MKKEEAIELGFKEGYIRLDDWCTLGIYHIGTDRELIRLNYDCALIRLTSYVTHGNITKEQLKSLIEILKPTK